MKRYIRSSIDSYRGYDIEIEKSGNQRYYFVDERGKVHYADLQEELEAKIDDYIRKNRITASSDLKSMLPRELNITKWYGGHITRGVDIDRAIEILLKDGWRLDPQKHYGYRTLRKGDDAIEVFVGESPRYAYIKIIEDSNVEASCITSSDENLKAYIVRYGWDTGNAETGPRLNWDEDIVYAESEEAAEHQWEEDNEFDLPDGYEGCSARKATQLEIQEWERARDEQDEVSKEIDDLFGPEPTFDLTKDQYAFLEDCAAITHAFTEDDFKDLQVGQAEDHAIDRYMVQFMAAQEDGDDNRSFRIGKAVARFLKSLK